MAERWTGIPRIEDLCLVYDTSKNPIPGQIVPCLMCAKPMIVRPYVGVPDQICPECEVVYDECARIVCFNCQVVVARVKPGVTDSGFHIRKRQVLHADRCNICAKAPEYSTIIEIDQWEKSLGRAVRLFIPVGFNPKKKDTP